MTLCQICQSTSFESLPPFPTDVHRGALDGLEHVVRFFRARGSRDVPMSRVRHHADLKSLQNAAENGCEVCLLIYEQALAMLAELETSKGKKSPYSPPSFDMSLSQRPDGGQGFWVWSAPISNTIRAEIAPVAAFTFVVAEGISTTCYMPKRAYAQAHLN